MWKLEKTTLVTNNDRVYEKYKDVTNVILLDTYEEVLYKVKDFVYDRDLLLTHPQASSLKPNQTPYRSVAVYPLEVDSDNEKYMNDIMLIEKCIETYHQWQDIAPTPTNYEERVANDFKTIDLSVVEGFMPRLS